MATPLWELPTDFVENVTPYTGAQIARFNRIAESQTTGALDTLLGDKTAVVVARGDVDSFAVTPGAGLSVGIAAGRAIVRHSVYGSCALATPAAIVRGALPANSVRYVFAAFERSDDVDSRVSGLPVFPISPNGTLDGGVPLAKLTTTSNSVVVEDLRGTLLVVGGNGGGDGNGGNGTGDGSGGVTTWAQLQGKPTTFAPSAHKSSHATGGSDALAPADIGAAPLVHSHLAEQINDFSQRVREVMEYATGAPVQTIADLRAVTAAHRQDKQQRYVEDENLTYRFNLQGTGNDDGAGIIVPSDDGVGRWFLSGAAAANTGNADTLGGQNAGYYLGRENHTGRQSIETIADLQGELDAKTETIFVDAESDIPANLAPGTTIVVRNSTAPISPAPGGVTNDDLDDEITRAQEAEQALQTNIDAKNDSNIFALDVTNNNAPSLLRNVLANLWAAIQGKAARTLGGLNAVEKTTARGNLDANDVYFQIFVADKPPAGAIVFSCEIPYAGTITIADIRVTSGDAATAASTYKIELAGAQIAGAAFAAAAMAATVTANNGATVSGALNDLLRITAPATADATLAKVRIRIKLVRN